MPADRPTSLVTGAAGGIGAAFAQALAARGHDLLLVDRRIEPLVELSALLARTHGIEAVAIPCDLAVPGAAVALADEISGQGRSVDWLVNNAGYGVPGAFDAVDWAVHTDFLRVMVEAPLALVRHFLPGMRARGYGRILNVASLAALVPGSAGHTLYAPAKALLIKASQSLALENADRGIHVTALCPGFTRTSFHDVAGTRARVERMPRYMWLSARRVVEEGIAAVEQGRPVHVPGRVNRMILRAFRLMPDRLAGAVVARQSRHWRAERGEEGEMAP